MSDHSLSLVSTKVYHTKIISTYLNKQTRYIHLLLMNDDVTLYFYNCPLTWICVFVFRTVRLPVGRLLTARLYDFWYEKRFSTRLPWAMWRNFVVICSDLITCVVIRWLIPDSCFTNNKIYWAKFMCVRAHLFILLHACRGVASCLPWCSGIRLDSCSVSATNQFLEKCLTSRTNY